MATSCADPLNNYMVYNDSEGIYTYAYEAEKNPDCLACGQAVHVVKMKRSDKLQVGSASGYTFDKPLLMPVSH